jgi:protein-L-isoaspartate(D-aspartate) O-methyltransferase
MPANYVRLREKMVKQQIESRGVKDERVLTAMTKVPRHRFVGEKGAWEAYGDYPLPIGQGQTISQPYIVALMTEALELTGNEITLEIGTGSGYQTAILAELSEWVYTIERIQPLMESAKRVLDDLGYDNISFRAFDGTLGWEEHEPFDAIIVTAAGPKIPKNLKDQLAEGGRLVIPVGSKFDQDLIKLIKEGDSFTPKSLGGCRFVNLIGINGWDN